MSADESAPGPDRDDEADLLARLALLSVTGIGPSRARWLLGAGEAVAAVEGLRRGRLPDDLGPAPSGVGADMVAQWGKDLRRLNVVKVRERHQRLGIGIMSPSHERWPLAEEPDPPALLFHQGNLDLLQLRPAIAVVGTRRCTTVGRTVAYRLGQDLASAGVVVVSGLALGVDGSAHRGVLDGGGLAIGVVGSGLDVVYPGGNRGLWNEVAAGGLLVSEAPAGAKPARWRFPARNRLIAGLSDGVVIVESHHRGGALLTADEAVDRGRSVFAVPGSVLSSASDGTNQLLFDGAVPVRSAADVLGHLGITDLDDRRTSKGLPGGVISAPTATAADEARRPGSGSPSPEGLPWPETARGDERPLTGLEDTILVETATGPVHLDVLVHAADSSAHDVLVAVQGLVAAGLVQLDGSTVSRTRQSP